MVQVSEFLALEGEFQMSAEQAQKLNRNLSKISANDVPTEKMDHVLDYLITALNLGAVDPQVKPDIEKLAAELQEVR